MLLSPDTDNIKKVYPGDEYDKTDFKVRFEGLGEFLGGPAPCEIHLGRVSQSTKKQVLFWQLTGDDIYTSDEDKANMTFLEVVVRINITGELRGPNVSSEAGYQLNVSSRPTGEVAVIFPVLVNNKAIYPKSELLVFKAKAAESTETDNKSKHKRTAVQISNVKNWDKQMAQIQKKAKGCA